MGFLVSPGVQVKEIDLTNIVPAVATTIGAVAGPFEKGPVGEITTISSEQDLVRIFGKPKDTSNQYEYFFTAANFLQYTNTLKVVRTESAVLNADADGGGILIKSTLDYQSNYRPNLSLGAANSSVGVFAAVVTSKETVACAAVLDFGTYPMFLASETTFSRTVAESKNDSFTIILELNAVM